jgi:predicted  nucleic acid-binding Zn-ribbon protein
MMQLMRELERINGNLGKKVEDSTNLERKVVQLNQEIENLRRQLKENEIAFNQKYEVEINRKVSTY